MAAPGPGRDFTGCPKSCGYILAASLGIVAAFVVQALILLNEAARLVQS
jgi:sulfite reductase beta subunit-like hemoprotein